MLWLSVGFVLGLTVGFPLGVLAYLSTYALFQKLSDDRLRRRVAIAQQNGITIGREAASKLHRMRSLHGPTLNEGPEVSSQMEEILGTGPGSDRP